MQIEGKRKENSTAFISTILQDPTHMFNFSNSVVNNR